jgi:hypothetical protein
MGGEEVMRLPHSNMRMICNSLNCAVAWAFPVAPVMARDISALERYV